MIDLRHMKMYVDVMNVVGENAHENFHWYWLRKNFLFDLIEMVERFVMQGNSTLDHMNDVEHDVTMINDLPQHMEQIFDWNCLLLNC